MKLDFIKDDGGRAAAGYKGETGDCVVRAVSILNGGTAASYKAAWADCLAAGKEVIARQRKNRGKGNPSPGAGVDKKACLLVYARNDLVKVDLRNWSELPTYAEAHARYGDCIVTTTGHICALVGGALHDLFDGRTYTWTDDWGIAEVRERKARAVWVRK